MRTPKIQKDELSRMLADGKTLSECARHFSVSPAAVSYARKKLGLIIAKDVQLESAHRFVNEHLDTVSQLKKINSDAHELLALCMDWMRGDGKAIQVLESQLTKKKVRVGDEEKFIEEVKMQNPKLVALKAMNEIREQLRLQNQTLSMLAEMSATVEFQQELIQILKEVDKNACDEFCRRIDQRQALRRAVRVNSPGD